MANKHQITAADILPLEAYAKVRTQTRRDMSERKKSRRVEVGPHVTFYFENYDTMWVQVQEMLHIERGGEAQMVDELAAYNPLVPQGQELVATFMIEIDDPERRKRILNRLGGIEETTFVQIGTEKIPGVAEVDQDRTTAEGKASSVQFVHFPFTPAQIAAIRTPGTPVIVGMGHANYNHMAVLPENVRTELSGDFD
jgi:predicted SnoaL-like aldol condensation-catalyzing enzyme